MSVYRIEWTHPSVAGKVVKLDLTGATVSQVVAGVQQRETHLVCASSEEYVAHVRAEELQPFGGLSVQASHTLHEGIPRFTIATTSQRPIAPAAVDNGAYVYVEG